MFTDKESFKKQYEEAVLEMYGQPLELAHPTEKFIVLEKLTRNLASSSWANTKEYASKNAQKQLYYFSMEFLLGRMLTNNLLNLGVYDVVVDGLKELGINYNDLEELEADPGLGNGGLGRLAACFLDSLATNHYLGNGNTLRYQFGLFKQKIVNGYQTEIPDQWMHLSNMWEVRKPKHQVDVRFYGKVGFNQDTKSFYEYDGECIKAVPYDIPIIGKEGNIVNTLRMWSSEVSEDIPMDKDFRRYSGEVNELCQNLYPDDSTIEGRTLRLKQQYFFVCAGLQSIIKSHLLRYKTLDNFSKYNVIQLNDTHPVLVIPELMRLLMDVHGYSWDKAYSIVNSSVAYTNHTILQEALEKWPIDVMKNLLPRIYMIIEEIDQRFLNDIKKQFNNDEMLYDARIIKDNQIYMANLAIVGSFSVNGVAHLHTEILKNDVMNVFYKIYPNKFYNQTNGISHRRWLIYSNPSLTNLLIDTIGDKFIKDASLLEDLYMYVDDKNLQERFLLSKLHNKRMLIDYVSSNYNIDIKDSMIFDMQIKRIHSYKRQLLSILYIMYEYMEMKSNPNYRITPTAFFFAGKAAPSYGFAKKVIKLINSVANVVNQDVDTNDFLKVIYIENYGVTIAEKMIPAANYSSQISTAGFEASGTSNMKFMMNGAVTIGTNDGANVEIHERVGDDNCIIFGLGHEEVKDIKNHYCSYDYYHNDNRIKLVLDSLISHYWNTSNEEFRMIYDDLLKNNDEYLLLADFSSFVDAKRLSSTIYQDSTRYAKMCLINISKSGYFSSDRTINSYVNDIWHINKIEE